MKDLILKILELIFGGLVQIRRVHAIMHKAYFVDTEPRIWAYFFKIANLSKGDIEVTHVGMDCGEDYIEAHPDERPLPKRLKPDEEWETWIEFDKLPNWIHDNPFPHGRVRLTTGRIIKTKRAKNIPPKGEVAGGLVRPEYSKH